MRCHISLERIRRSFSVVIVLAFLFVQPLAFSQGNLGAVSFTEIVWTKTAGEIEEEIDAWISSGRGALDWPSKEFLIKSLSDVGVSSDNINMVLVNGNITNAGYYKLRIDKQIWSIVSAISKQQVYDSFSKPARSQTGLNVSLTITKDSDLAAIAKKYSGERDPGPIERLLNKYLSRNATGEVTIPIEKILAPVIREEVNRFASYEGPNCFNAALCVNKGRDFVARYLGGNDIASTEDVVLSEVNAIGYRHVFSDEKLSVGDLMIYFSKNGEIVHATSYIGDDLVFTKNGLAQNRPYLFQKRGTVEKIYFKDDVFYLAAFRFSKDPQRKPIKDLLDHPFYAHPSLNVVCTKLSYKTVGPEMTKFKAQPAEAAP